MIDFQLNNKLKETFETCDIHLKRMFFAKSKVENMIPLTFDSYYSLSNESISFLDQFIYRFSKLQDVMGSRLFPFLLEALAESTEKMAFIDVLNRLERLGIIESAQSWLLLRKIRNDISHEYPSSLSERLEGINLLFQEFEVMENILSNSRKILLEKINVSF
jgi:hypothetical protein